MSELILTIGIDTSGQPYEDIYVGLSSIKSDYIKSCEKKFKKQFSQELRSKQKGSKKSISELISILTFLSNNTIYMRATYFPSSEWKDYNNIYKNKANIKERVYSLLYFQVIDGICFKHTKNPYTISVCAETNINIKKVLDYLNYLLKANGYNTLLNIGYSKFNLSIKFADYIASGYRKIDHKFLNNLKNIKLYTTKGINKNYIKKVFEK